MLIRSPTRVYRLAVDPDMTSIDNRFWLGVPGSCIGACRRCFGHPDSLHIFTKISLNRSHIIFIQHHTSQDNGKLSSSAMSPMGLPPSMALLYKTI
ncbi:MAG: hypothetical protein ACXVZU_04390 [Methanobacteriaceae archaeon]